MRNFLFLAASAAALLVAGSASADALSGNLQVNVAPQVASSQTHNVRVGGKLDVDTLAVGSNLSVLADSNDFAGAINLQGNLAPQVAGTSLTNSVVVGKTNISTQAVGNNASVESVDRSAAAVNVQVNAAQQTASTVIQGNADSTSTTTVSYHPLYFFHLSPIYTTVTTATPGLKGNVKTNTTAVGSSLDVTADNTAFALSGQLNLAPQVATTLFDNNFAGADVDLSTAAVGNIANVTGGQNAIGLTAQGNFAPQIAATAVTNSRIAGNLSVSTQAIGNSVSVKTGN